MSTALQSGFASSELTIPEELSFLAPAVVDGLIRIGKVNDGGYVVPALLVEETEFLISLGISDDWSFEEHFKKLKPGIQIHAYDHSISGSLFLASALRGFAKMLFRLTSRDNFARRYRTLVSYRNFFTGQVHHFRERVNDEICLAHDVTLEKIIQRTNSNKLFLKIDIEGSEYKIVDDILRHSARVVGMAIEFHNTRLSRSAFLHAMQLLDQQFEIVHLHANNFGPVGKDNLPEALEITFSRRSRFESTSKRERLPIPLLDSPNNPNKPDYRMNFQ